MINKVIISILFLIVSNLGYTQISTQFHHYDYYNFSQEKIKPTASIYVHNTYNEKISFTSFSLINDKWGECLIGVEYMPIQSLAIELEVGIETNLEPYGYKKNLFRYAGIITFSTEKISINGVYEYGTINWFDIRGTYTFKQLSTGVMVSQYYGYGPLLKYHFGKSPFKIWGSYILDWETLEYGAMLGLLVTVKKKINNYL